MTPSLRVGYLDHTLGKMLSIGIMWSRAKFQGDHMGQMLSRHSMCSWFISDFFIYFMLHWNAWSHWDSCTKHRNIDFLAPHIVRSHLIVSDQRIHSGNLGYHVNSFCQSYSLYFLLILFLYLIYLYPLFLFLGQSKPAKKWKIKNSFKFTFLLQLWPKLWVVCF